MKITLKDSVTHSQFINPEPQMAIKKKRIDRY